MLLSYDIAVVGAANVDRALSGIERRFVQHNARVERIAGKPPGRGSAAGPGAGASVVAREGVAAERKILAERERAERYVARLRQRHQLDAQRQEERAAKSSAREQERSVRHIESIKRRHFAERDRLDARDSERNMRQRQRFAERTTGTIGGSVRSTLGGVGRAVGGALAIGGGFAAADAVNRNLDLGRRQRQLTIQSAAVGGENPITPRDVQSRVESIATERGIDREDLTGALETVVQKTGNLAEGMKNLEQFAVLGQAFNATTADMAGAAAVLGEKFGLTGDELADTLATLGAQGRKAAFEFKDMASLVERLAAAGQRFNFTGKEGVETLGGFTQIARGATGSSEQAATAVEATIRQLIAKAPEIQSGKAFGEKVQVFEGGDPTKAARPFTEVVEDVIASSGGDQTKLQKVFGDEGIRGISPLMTAFSKANREAGGGKAGEIAGRAAIQAMFSEAIEASGTYADAQTDAAKVLEDDSTKLKMASEKISVALGGLSPIVVRLAESIAQNEKEIAASAEAAGKVAQFLIANPFTGIGAIVAAKVTADVAAAGIGNAVSKALTTAMATAGIGPLVAAALVAAIAAAAISIDIAEKNRVEALEKERGDPAALKAKTEEAIKSGDKTAMAAVLGANVADKDIANIQEGAARRHGVFDMLATPNAVAGTPIAGFGGSRGELVDTVTTSRAQGKEAQGRIDQLSGAALDQSSKRFAEAVASFSTVSKSFSDIAQQINAATSINRSDSPTQPRK